MRFVRENSLGLFFGAIFLMAVLGQAFAGYHAYNEEQMAHMGDTIGFGRYLTSSNYGRAVMENWQSEYLQFALYIFATIYFVQRGSPESKELGKAGRESEEDQLIGPHAHDRSPPWARAGGVKTFLLSNSLLIVMLLIFLGSWLTQSFTGWTDYNQDQADHKQPGVSWIGYLGTATFWESTLQNWQSEFLAVGSMAVLAIYLRQRGSPESKPVGAPHEETASSG